MFTTEKSSKSSQLRSWNPRMLGFFLDKAGIRTIGETSKRKLDFESIQLEKSHPLPSGLPPKCLRAAPYCRRNRAQLPHVTCKITPNIIIMNVKPIWLLLVITAVKLALGNANLCDWLTNSFSNIHTGRRIRFRQAGLLQACNSNRYRIFFLFC